jgi:hypothetical protein
MATGTMNLDPTGLFSGGSDTMLLLQTQTYETEQDELDSTERRRGLRIRQSRPVKVLDMLGGRFFGGQTRDVSATGLRLELPSDARLHVGATLHIHVGATAAGDALPNRRSVLPVRVVWVRPGRGLEQTLTAGVELATTIGAQRYAA